MKRFMKGCGITALIFAALGFVLAMAGGSIAGRSAIADAVESATGGRVHMNPYSWWGWGINVSDGLIDAPIADMVPLQVSEEAGQSVDYGWDGSAEEPGGDYTAVQDQDPMFSHKYDVITGSREKYCPGDGIQNLDIEIGGCAFYTQESDDENIWLEVMNVHRFQAYVKGDTLHIKAKSAGVSDLSEGEIILYLPDGYGLTDVDMEMGAGNFFFTDLNVTKVSLEVGAGQVEIQNLVATDMDVSVGAGYVWISNMQVTELDVEVGMGVFSADGAVNGNVDVECSMGNVEMTLEGSEQDFNYSLEVGMGTIQLNDNTYGGLAEERDINNHAAKEMDIECSMGNVAIMFLN